MVQNMASEGAISIAALHSQVAGRLRERIVNGTFKPGTKIKELAVCDWLGVSRTPLREAIKVLAAEGFIVLTPNRGARVAHPTVSRINEHREMTQALEQFAIKKLCKKRDEHTLQLLESIHATFLDSIKRNDIDAFVDANGRFHQAIVEDLDNSIINEAYQLQIAHLVWARLISGRMIEYVEEAGQEHGAIMDAVRAGDATGARDALDKHHSNLDFEQDFANSESQEEPEK